jgi:hypothetical protein
VPTATPRNQCWPEGVPFILGNMGMQMIQQPDKIVILYDHDHQIRHVRMNEPHPVRVTPSSVGGFSSFVIASAIRQICWRRSAILRRPYGAYWTRPVRGLRIVSTMVAERSPHWSGPNERSTRSEPERLPDRLLWKRWRRRLAITRQTSSNHHDARSLRAPNCGVAGSAPHCRISDICSLSLIREPLTCSWNLKKI